MVFEDPGPEMCTFGVLHTTARGGPAEGGPEEGEVRGRGRSGGEGGPGRRAVSNYNNDCNHDCVFCQVVIGN